MKIVLLAELVSVLKDLHTAVTGKFNISDSSQNLPTGKSYRLFNDNSSTSLYLISYGELISFQNFSVPLNSTLRDDFNLTIQTRYNTFGDIVRESSSSLYKARNSFPLIQGGRLSDDELESMEFQLLTKYTQNEVNSMILYNRYMNIRDDTHPRVGVDFMVYDILSEEDLQYLIDIVKGYIINE